MGGSRFGDALRAGAGGDRPRFFPPYDLAGARERESEALQQFRRLASRERASLAPPVSHFGKRRPILEAMRTGGHVPLDRLAVVPVGLAFLNSNELAGFNAIRR